jgi:glycosyltransferase involved in cell wall biosynthesis
MHITVIVCTYNRCESLGKALASIASSVLPDAVEWEVLIVDNNSRDQTRAVSHDFSDRYPGRFRYLFEPKQGKSNALNAGIRATAGQILAFTDDDVTVDPLWLQNVTAPLLINEWAGAAGRIRLEPNFQPPAWLAITGPFSLAAPLAAEFDRGEDEGPLDELPYGANMAFRRFMFEKYGDFRADLGPTPGDEIRGEDTEFAGRLMAAGERLYYVPSAVVNHRVPQERVKKRYFRSYYFAQGRSVARLKGIKLPIRKIPGYSLSEIRGKLRWVASLDRQWFLNAHGRFFCELAVLHILGQIVEGYRCFNGPRTKPGSQTAGPLQKAAG